MTKIFISAVLALFITTISTAQELEKSGYRSPVDFTITLAGNFGEIRPNHFHSGIDIKALQGVGSPVRAVADGFVSRIGVAPSGYGNFMMVTHRDGKSTLYAHLDTFAKPYKEYIESEMHKAKKYEVDLYLQAGQFPVKAGDVIATLGNSGSSAGPHLHFEIREGAIALNPLTEAGYHVSDKVAPTLFKVHVYQRDTVIFGVPIFTKKQTIEYKTDKNGVRKPDPDTIKVSKPFYLAYEVIDYKDGRTNTMGVKSLSQKIDGIENFSFDINKIHFSTTRFINSLVQFDENRKTKFNTLRAYVSSNNQLSIYKNVANNGLVNPPTTGQILQVETYIADECGNPTYFKMPIIRGANDTLQQNSIGPTKNHKAIFSNMPFGFEDSTMRINIDPDTFYDTGFIEILNKNGNVMVGSANIPLQKNVSLTIKSQIPMELRQKALIALVGINGKLSSQGGRWSNDGVTTKTRSLGEFKIAFDTIAPKITPLQQQGTTPKGSYLKFKISDDLAGISTYNIFVDDKWVIGEYDPKNNLLQTRIKPTTTPTTKSIRVEVVDKKDNKTVLNHKYKW